MTSSDLQSAFDLRRCILEHLYAWFKDYPLAPVELSRLTRTCDAAPREINWNLVYLEKKGYLNLDPSNDCPPYVSCTTELTGAGIDLAENPEGMDKLFFAEHHRQ